MNVLARLRADNQWFVTFVKKNRWFLCPTLNRPFSALRWSWKLIFGHDSGLSHTFGWVGSDGLMLLQICILAMGWCRSSIWNFESTQSTLQPCNFSESDWISPKVCFLKRSRWVLSKNIYFWYLMMHVKKVTVPWRGTIFEEIQHQI